MKKWNEEYMKRLLVLILITLVSYGYSADKTQVLVPFFKVLGKLQVGQKISARDSLILFNSTYGFRDSSGVIQFRGSADSKWRVLSDTVGGTGDEVTITKDAGTGELSFKAPYKAYADTSNALWMGFTSDNPMLNDGMRNQMFYGNRVAIYDSAGYDKIIHYAVNNVTERFTIVLTDTIFHRGFNDTIPSNIYLVSQDRAGIWMDSADTLYYHGYLEAGRYTVFHNDFYVTNDGNNKYLKVIFPEWFEVPVSFSTSPPNSTTDLIECFEAAYRFKPCTVEFGAGYRYETDSLWVGELVSWTAPGVAYLYLGDNAADTAIWVGGDDPGWDIPYTTGDVTTSVIRNIYIKGTRYSALKERVSVFVKRPALGHSWENMQVWAGARNGCEIYRPNAGPCMYNCWFDSNLGTGIKVWGGANHFYWISVFAEGNGTDPDSIGYYQIHVQGTNRGYIASLHSENAADTVFFSDNCSNGYIGHFTWGGATRNDSSVVMLSNLEDWSVGQMSAYSIDNLGTVNDEDELLYGNGQVNSSPVSATTRASISVAPNAFGMSQVWPNSIGGSSDMEYMPGDTISNWSGFAGFFTRKNNQPGLGGVYNTGNIHPLFYINNNGIVRPTLSGVPYKASTDTLPTLDFTGDTNASDSLTTLMTWIQTHMITNGKIPGKFFRRMFEYEQ